MIIIKHPISMLLNIYKLEDKDIIVKCKLVDKILPEYYTYVIFSVHQIFRLFSQKMIPGFAVFWFHPSSERLR